MNVKYEGISCQWHCPNCGALVQGIKNGDGIAMQKLWQQYGSKIHGAKT